MKTITLLRHADTISREEYRLTNKKDKSDLFRPLSKLGKIQSKHIAKFALEHLSFDLVVCSPAKRTLQTLKPLKKFLPKNCIMISEYIAPDCGLEGYMKLTQNKAFMEAQNVLIIGHQPDLKSFATYIAPPFNALVPKGVLIRLVLEQGAKNLAKDFEGSGVIDFVIPPFVLEDFKTK